MILPDRQVNKRGSRYEQEAVLDRKQDKLVEESFVNILVGTTNNVYNLVEGSKYAHTDNTINPEAIEESINLTSTQTYFLIF